MRTELLRERYEPLEVVGKGGEGDVLRALDHLHGRHVALKVRPVADEASRTHLLSEARLLLSLSPHPGLPLVREDFFADDRYVIAMDWIDGMNLEALLELEGRPGLDPVLAVDYLEQAAEALAHLHSHDPPVVHGDVKPANLILTSSGRIVVVDFGLSSTPTDDARRAGTAGYVAPEVAAGARPSPASDVYSFAATALTLLTGRPPDGAPNWGTIERERIPALERIVRANLATDPQRRDGSAPALAARLRRWWGDALPRGTVTLMLTDATEASVDEVARTHRGHCVAPAGDGPVLAAFASAQDAFEAARELATRLGARVAAVTVEAEPRAGSYREDAAATRLSSATAPEQVLVDNATAARVDSDLPPEIALAEVPAGWAVVAPGLRIPPRAATCPYRGLIAFGSEDDDLFFGREEVVTSIFDRLLEGGFMAVVGASGSGKSSLVRAGLVPAFRREREGSVVVMTPGTWSRDAGRGHGLLIVDQFEEVFTLWSDESLRTAFLDELMDSAAPVVIALRADFYGRCAEHPRLAAAVAEHQHLLGPMRNDELRRAIEGPARAAGLRLEAGLVDAMLSDVEGEPGALPLLSHALYECWLRRDGRVLTTAGYRAAGGVRGAIAQSAEAVFLACSPEEQALMRRMFLRLTELGEATEDTRRRVPLADLAPGPLLEQLTAARLLVVGDDSAEIAHEALIREWPRLRGWLAEDREALRALRQLTAAARSWDETGRNDADLYRGPRLAAALEAPGDLSRGEGEFLDASKEAQTRELTDARRRARRLRVLLVAVAVAFVAALVAGAFALVQRGRARHSATTAQAGRLAAQSREVGAKHPDLALLLALEGDRLHDSVDALGALLGALEHGSRIRTWLQGFDAPVEASAFSPDGKLLATATQKGTTLWDTATWRPSGPPLRSSQGGWDWVDFSPDGRRLAIAGGQGRVELWNVATRKKVRDLTDTAAAASTEPALAFVRYSPDGRVIAAGPQEANHVTLWDAASGRPIGRPIIAKRPGTGGAQWASFSPDSKRIAVPGAQGRVGIFEVATGRRVGKPLTVGSADAEAAIFTPDGRALIVSDDDGSVSTIDIATRRAVRPPLSVGSDPAAALALSPDGRLLAAASFDGPVFVWDLKTGEPYGPPLAAGTSPVNDVAFSPGGRTLVSSHLRSAVVWNVNGVQAIGRPLGGRTDLTTDVAFSPDGKLLAAGQFDGGATIYDAATRREKYRIAGGSVTTAVAFDFDGKYLALGTIGGTAQLFDAKSGAVVGRPLDVGHGAIWQLAFSPDARLLAIAVDRNGVDGFNLQRRQGEVQLWHVDTGGRVGRAIVPGAGSVLSVAFNGDGTLLSTGSYKGRLDLWDVGTQRHHGKPMTVVDDGVPSVAFDPTDELVAGGGAIGPARVWRVADQRPAFPPLAGHIGPITGTAFAAPGSFLATTTLFGATRLWDPATGLAYGDEFSGSQRVPSSHTPPIDLPFLGLRNAFSPDGKLLAVGGIETLAMLWDVDPAVWRRRACGVAGRNLTREEWKLYLPAGTPYRATCSEWPAG